MGTRSQRPGDDTRAVAARFTQAYTDLSPRVLGYFRSHGVDDPGSVTQEVFLALYQNFDRVSGGDDAVRTLTFSIAHARLVDHARARARRPHLAPFEPESDPRSSASAEDTAAHRLGEHGLAPLLLALGEDQREAVLLRVIAGLSLEESSSVMGKSVGAVKQLQRRALESLRAALGGEPSHD